MPWHLLPCPPPVSVSHESSVGGDGCRHGGNLRGQPPEEPVLTRRRGAARLSKGWAREPGRCLTLKNRPSQLIRSQPLGPAPRAAREWETAAHEIAEVFKGRFRILHQWCLSARPLAGLSCHAEWSGVADGISRVLCATSLTQVRHS